MYLFYVVLCCNLQYRIDKLDWSTCWNSLLCKLYTNKVDRKSGIKNLLSGIHFENKIKSYVYMFPYEMLHCKTSEYFFQGFELNLLVIQWNPFALIQIEFKHKIIQTAVQWLNKIFKGHKLLVQCKWESEYFD